MGGAPQLFFPILGTISDGEPNVFNIQSREKNEEKQKLWPSADCNYSKNSHKPTNAATTGGGGRQQNDTIKEKTAQDNSQKETENRRRVATLPSQMHKKGAHRQPYVVVSGTLLLHKTPKRKR